MSEQTRIAILDAAWDLVAESGRLEAGQAEIAARAGVSRQTVYLAFGGRAGLLLAMLHNHDRQSPHVRRLNEVAQGSGDRPQDLYDFLGAWLDYLPDIFPVGILLDAASLHDAEAAAAWDDRMKAALLTGVRVIARRLESAGWLAPTWSVDAAAELAWSLVHPTAWRLLVIQCGWSPDAFRRSRFELIGRTLLVAAPPTAANAPARRGRRRGG